MNTVAINGFKDILTETYDNQGWTIPDYIIDYQSRLLADKLDKANWQPLDSYAETYMRLDTPTAALALGNTCWFTRAVFPELGQRRGINSSYYVQLGQGCYDRVLKYSTIPAIRALRDHFEFLAEATYTAIRHHGHFREMWD